MTRVTVLPPQYLFEIIPMTTSAGLLPNLPHDAPVFLTPFFRMRVELMALGAGNLGKPTRQIGPVTACTFTLSLLGDMGTVP